MLRFLSPLIGFFCLPVQALEVLVSVYTLEEQPMPGAVIYLTSDQPLPSVAEHTVAEMDQVNKQFSPHILVVQKGTEVSFPNSDSIQHHVYSFSPAKTFQLQLYKDQRPEPLPFKQQGKVELGCNVHDWMLGYIYVVDTPYFGQTDDQGLLKLNVPAGDYHLHVRHPRIQEPSANLDQPLRVSTDQKLSVRLEQPLLPGLDDFEEDTDEFIGYE
jgi:plastocyanin